MSLFKKLTSLFKKKEFTVDPRDVLGENEEWVEPVEYHMDADGKKVRLKKKVETHVSEKPQSCCKHKKCCNKENDSDQTMC
jgi:hypothetical protein